MSNSNHTLPIDENIELVVTDIQIRDAFDARENLNLRLEAPNRDPQDLTKIIYVRMNMVTDELNGAYNSVCAASPKFRLATKDMSAKQVRHYIHKYLRTEDSNPWNMLGTAVNCRIVTGNEHPDGGNYPDTVYINSVANDNLSDTELDAMLDATDYFTPTPTEELGDPIDEVEQAMNA